MFCKFLEIARALLRKEKKKKRKMVMIVMYDNDDANSLQNYILVVRLTSEN